MDIRQATISRQTSESEISLTLNLDGQGDAEIQTGIGFFDHMLSAFTKYACVDLQLSCNGDLIVDDHHTVEDCAIALGMAINDALDARRGIARFGSAYAPLDEALARTVIDLSGRSTAVINIGLKRNSIGQLSCENVSHFFSSLASKARASVHIDVLRGENDHHRAEAAFKSFALAFRQAVVRDGTGLIPSTKGII